MRLGFRHPSCLAGLTSVSCSAAVLLLAGCPTGTTVQDTDAGQYVVGPDGSIEMAGDSGPPLPVNDGGPCISLTTVPPSQIPAYTTVSPQLDACNGTQISDFVSACTASGASASACSSFQTTPGNTGCMACLFPKSSSGAAMNTGGVLLDYAGKAIVGVNTPGCIALADPKNGPACAAVLEPLYQCEEQACSSADCVTSDAGTYQMCLDGAEMGACSSQSSAASSTCTPDYEDGGAALVACATDTLILNEICGTGM